MTRRERSQVHQNGHRGTSPIWNQGKYRRDHVRSCSGTRLRRDVDKTNLVLLGGNKPPPAVKQIRT